MKMTKASIYLLIAASGAWALSGCRGKAPSAPAAGGERAGQVAAAHKALYQCPMHPSYTSDKPGECPICGMKLIPIEEGKEGTDITSTVPGRVTVMIPPERQQIIGVKTGMVAVRPLATTIRAVGRIAYDPDLYQAEKEYIEALMTRQRIGRSSPEKSLVEASVLRLRQLGLNDELIEDLARTKRPSLNLLLPEETMWVYAQVYEYELEWVKVGQPVSVTTLAYPGEVFQGMLRAVDPVLDPMTRTVRIRAVIANPGKKLKPNFFVNVEIRASRGEGLTVPSDAVIDTGTRKIVFVDRGNGVLEPREVTTGPALDGDIQVLSGLTDGERVVTSANFLIDSESSLKAAVKQMGGMPGMEGMGGKPEKPEKKGTGSTEGMSMPDNPGNEP